MIPLGLVLGVRTGKSGAEKPETMVSETSNDLGLRSLYLGLGRHVNLFLLAVVLAILAVSVAFSWMAGWHGAKPPTRPES